jgi:FixJ family two-component response regulator
MTATISFLPRTVPVNRDAEAEPNGLVAIVDDDESVRRALGRLLRAHSFDVQAYQSAQDFLDHLNADLPVCLIVDLQMEGMTGLELLHHLAGEGVEIPAVVVTAHDEPGMQHRCELAGAVGFLIKPVTKETLLDAIAAALGQSSAAKVF